MEVTIDPGSGFCFGVRKAIEQAESQLEKNGQLFCLGDIVHNKAEMDRLGDKGLTRISIEEMGRLKRGKVLFRAHGEPPSSYSLVNENEITLTDATCPIVRKLQERIKKSWEHQKEVKGQVLIFGNPDHPETIGLQGQTGGAAIIVTGPDDLGSVDPGSPVELFSQTTMSKDDYRILAENLRDMMRKHYPGTNLPLKVHNTICGQISGRTPRIRKFAAVHDVIIFVGGSRSSNAKILFGHCLEVNPRSHFISLPGDLNAGWFTGAATTGVCGATSTPMWLMEQVAEKIREMG